MNSSIDSAVSVRSLLSTVSILAGSGVDCSPTPSEGGMPNRALRPLVWEL